MAESGVSECGWSTDGAVVRVGGIEEGTVARITLPGRPDQLVLVGMDLKPATRTAIKKNSMAAIRTEGLVGDQYVESRSAPSLRRRSMMATRSGLKLRSRLQTC